MLVDFLRVWYDDNELSDRLTRLQSASASRAYLERAIERNVSEGHLRKRLLLGDIEASLPDYIDPKFKAEILRHFTSLPECAALAMNYWTEGKSDDALHALGEAVSEETIVKNRIFLLSLKATLEESLNRFDQVAMTCTILADLPEIGVVRAFAIYRRGRAYEKLGRTGEALSDFEAVLGFPDLSIELRANTLIERGRFYSDMGERARAIEDCAAVVALPDAPVEEIATALRMRGDLYSELNFPERAIDDYTAVQGLPNVRDEAVATALYRRGLIHATAGRHDDAMQDYSEAIRRVDETHPVGALARGARGLSRAARKDFGAALEDITTAIAVERLSVEGLARMLEGRAVVFVEANDLQKAKVDLEAVLRMTGVQDAVVVDVLFDLAEVYFREGNWDKGIEFVDAGLARGGFPASPNTVNLVSLIAVLFTAGLSPTGRNATAAELFGVYAKHGALAQLGESLIRHIGEVYQGNGTRPSRDNLEQWLSAWTRASEGRQNFQLTMRLLETAVDFVKTGGKDPNVLLRLSLAERSIVRQALGLDGKTDRTRAPIESQ